MNALTYRIKLLEPTLVTALEGDPNEGVAFDYLPGSVLRGAVIGKYLAGNGGALDAADKNARRLFFDGATRYLNGYLVDASQDRRSLPTPESWQRQKGDEGTAKDFTCYKQPENDSTQWQRVGKPFCSISGDDSSHIRLLSPERLVTVHTQRDRIYGRAMPGSGAVYRYDALASGQIFEAVVLCEDSDAATLKGLLTDEVSLGGSRNGGYGRASVAFHQEQDASQWREAHGDLKTEVEANLVVTSLSDVLLRDGNGQFAVDPEVITTALEEELKPAKLQLDRTRTYLRGETLGGFNRKWGLPLPQVLAVGMGSVLVFKAADVPESQLTELELKGLGERRTEGFGRVAFNWHAEESLTVLPVKGNSPGGLAPLTDPESKRLAELMAERMLRRRLDEELATTSNSLGDKIRKPSNAQISRLRQLVQDELRQQPEKATEVTAWIQLGRTRFTAYLEDLEKRQTTRKQFSSDRLAGMSLMDWLRLRAATVIPDSLVRGLDQQQLREMQTTRGIWDVLQVQPLPQVGGVAAERTTALAHEYNLRLVEAVLARAAKQNRKEGD